MASRYILFIDLLLIWRYCPWYKWTDITRLHGHICGYISSISSMSIMSSIACLACVIHIAYNTWSIQYGYGLELGKRASRCQIYQTEQSRLAQVHQPAAGNSGQVAVLSTSWLSRLGHAVAHWSHNGHSMAAAETKTLPPLHWSLAHSLTHQVYVDCEKNEKNNIIAADNSGHKISTIRM